MQKYTVFDVETPNHSNNRISAIGVTTINDNSISQNYYSLINPETHFDGFNIRLTGINQEIVKDAPTFPEIWGFLAPFFDESIIVAHNAIFDICVLKRCLQYYNISWKSSIRYLCTVQIGRKILPSMKHNLNVICEHYSIPLEHHNAASDSDACAKILLRYIQTGVDINSFIKNYDLCSV